MSNANLSANQNQGVSNDVPQSYFKYPFCPFKDARRVAYERDKRWKRNSS